MRLPNINLLMHCLPDTKHDLMLCSTAVNEGVYEQPWIETQVVPGEVQSVTAGEGSFVDGELSEYSGETGEAVDAPSNGEATKEESVEANHPSAAVKVNPRKVLFAFVWEVPCPNLSGVLNM